MTKNKSAIAMNKLRWKNTTPEQRKAHSKMMLEVREKKKKESNENKTHM